MAPKLWLEERNIDKYYQKVNICKQFSQEERSKLPPLSSGSIPETSSDNDHVSKCMIKNPLSPNSTFFSIQSWHTHTFSRFFNGSHNVGFSGTKNGTFTVEVFDLRNGAKISETLIKDNCMEESQGNIEIGVFACALTDKLKIFSLINGEILATFENLRIRDLSFGDMSNYIYFGAFGDDYFGYNSRGGYGVILTNSYSKIQSLNPKSNESWKDSGRS